MEGTTEDPLTTQIVEIKSSYLANFFQCITNVLLRDSLEDHSDKEHGDRDKERILHWAGGTEKEGERANAQHVPDGKVPLSKEVSKIARYY